MSKEAEILRKCVSCHDEHMCQNQGDLRGLCIYFLIVKKIKPLNKPYLLQKRKQLSCVNLFSNTQKQNDESCLSVNMHCNHCIQNGTTSYKMARFLIERILLR